MWPYRLEEGFEECVALFEKDNCFMIKGADQEKDGINGETPGFKS